MSNFQGPAPRRTGPGGRASGARGNGGEDVYGAASVANALRALAYLGGRDTARVTDVSDHLGVARSTAHRLLHTLRLHGFVEQVPGGRQYRLGPVLMALAESRAAVESRSRIGTAELVRIARPFLEQLRDEAGETSNLLQLDGPDALFLDGVDGPHVLRVAPRTGDRVPAYATAGGKAQLAQLPVEAVRMLYPAGLDQLTPATVADLAELEADLARARRRGYALNIDESVTDVHGFGMPVRDGHGVCVAAVTVSAPSTRGGRARAAGLAPLLRRAADGITSRL
ncbi:IclR family transcriptional regulator [Streptomyces sp. TS71-3]|uniref:IclR family transcriptional regulator n=1 Tax=Streptomyces sp. TS71-3 TaxID=2733862 RepID=UPI001AFF2A5C|nr:IclR family transcriptional regulator [Streptomyces sp. TS71-3]GHJ42425.1 IclR family transcriptional regulator [Streptomyces sp. TS71-3]